MNIHIQSHGFTVTDALSELIQIKLATALVRHSARVERIEVRLGDENGPRGGVDKYCRIHVRLVDGTTSRAFDRDAELYAAIDRASQTVSRSVARHVGSLSTTKRIGPGVGRREFRIDQGREGASRGEHG